MLLNLSVNRISLYDQQNSKFVFIAKISLQKKIFNTVEGKIAQKKRKNETQRQASQTFELVSQRFGGRQATNGERQARRRQLESRTRRFYRRRNVVKHCEKDGIKVEEV